ncbi:MAG: hypothetical protein GWN72_08295 [Nitrospinaceae bacterium]|nr:hypothetical protein [Nitrospinaceae bacterium]NIU96371.1 hypothetical protein [Nitrospinaceae bacterium]NIW59006.1 hypothetical protein [Nitrospinaceae bacterium]
MAVFLFNSPAFAADAWFVEDMNQQEAILEPGTTTYCNKDFLVENMSGDPAEVHVILGNGSNYSFDMLEPNSKKEYQLKGGYEQSGGWQETQNVHIDEARIVNSTAGNSKIKVHCK